MKQLFIYLLIVFCATNSFSQIKDGSKVLTSTLSSIGIGMSKSKSIANGSPDFLTKSQGFGFTLEGTYGKVRKSSLWSYGLNFSWRLNTQSNGGSNFHSIGAGPVISYEYFYRITDKFYFSPFFRFNTNYQYSKQDATATSSAFIQKGIAGSLMINPFSLTFSKSPKTNFLLVLGNVSLNYDRTKSFYQPSLNDGKTISSNFNLNSSVGGIGFGIQKLF